MSTFDDEIARLAKDVSALSGASLPAIPRDASGSLRLDGLLARVRESSGSDLLLVAGVPPTARIDGRLIAIDPHVLDAEAVRDLVAEILDEARRRRLETERAIDFSFDRPGLGRFRFNV